MLMSVLRSLPFFFNACPTCGREQTAFSAEDRADGMPLCHVCADDGRSLVRIFRYSYQPSVRITDAAQYFLAREVLDEVASYSHNGARVVLLLPKVGSGSKGNISGGYVSCGNPSCCAIISEEYRFCSIMCAAYTTQEGSADSESEATMYEEIDFEYVQSLHNHARTQVLKKRQQQQQQRQERLRQERTVFRCPDEVHRRKALVPRQAPCM